MKLTQLFLLLTTTLFLQHLTSQNLIPNPSFESYNETFCGLMQNDDLEITLNQWLNPVYSSPDVYFKTIDATCYNYQPDSEYDGPIGFKGNQTPKTGDVMVGLWLYTIQGFNQRDYVQVKLNTPMEAGKSYVVEFYTSFADHMEYFTSNIGAHLSIDPISASDLDVLEYTPQMKAEGIITQSADWVLISDTIVAAQSFEFITIGNFDYDNDVTLQINPDGSGLPGTYGSYYFIDDVRVEETIQGNTVDQNQLILKELSIQPNPTEGLLKINLPHISSDYKVRFFNIIGQFLFETNLTSEQTELDISNFDSGIYLMEISNGKNRITRKVVKE